jgi:hypothetical protein
MQDPFVIPHLVPKTRRICANPVCAKLLSKLNKQEFCFTCYNRATMTRSELPSYRPSATRFVR